MGKRFQTGYLLVIGAVSVLLVVLCTFLFMDISGMFLDEWETKNIYFDIDGDGTKELFALDCRKLSLISNDDIIWETPAEWKVVDFLLSDIDRDEKTEILFLVWKRGSFGEYTPFWEENDNNFTQHIFIYQWEDNRPVPIWMSSELKPKVCSWEIMEKNAIHIITDSGEDTVWIWNSWGLMRWK